MYAHTDRKHKKRECVHNQAQQTCLNKSGDILRCKRINEHITENCQYKSDECADIDAAFIRPRAHQRDGKRKISPN